MIFFFIFQIIKACEIENLSICLTEIGDDFITFSLSNINGLSYGFWSQYGSMNPNYEANLRLSYSTLQGQTLMREVDPITKQNLFLYYQQFIQNGGNSEQHLILQGDNKITEFSFEPYSYEGKWIYHYFCFIFPDTIQVIIYDFQNCIIQNLNYQRSYQQTITINLGGQYQFNDGQQNIQLGYFKGRLSILDIKEQPTLFSTEQQFLQYVGTLNQPIPSCNIEVFEGTEIQNYKYQYGLILIESWVKIDYVSTLDIAVSVFGVEFALQQSFKFHQKLVDLTYVVQVSKTLDHQNGVYFQALEQTEKDYVEILQSYFNVNSVVFHQFENNKTLKDWHFVQIYYGFDGDQPIQRLNMVLQEGKEHYEKDLNKKIYRFYERNLIIRAGKLFYLAQDGVSVSTSLSKISVCLPTVNDFNKQCYNGCSDCDGPQSTDCLSCNVNSNRHYENRQCKCNLGFVEDNYGQCMEFTDLYPNSQQIFVPNDQIFYQFGVFPFIYQNTTYYLECPKYRQQSNRILCIECLSDPEAFASNLMCQTDYVKNDHGQYQPEIRQPKDIELYIIDYELLQITLCVGCSQFCDPSVDDQCFKINSLQRYIQCTDGYFYENEECKQCAGACSKCKNSINCLECSDQTLVLNPINGICTSCAENCLKCDFDELNNLICLQCRERYSLYQGHCMACGINCKLCIYLLDQLTNTFYNRCISCLDNQQYYLLFNAVDCAVNSISNCQYVIQFHKSWYLRMYDNTMFHLFERKNYSPSEIFTYCAACNLNYAATMSSECVKISTIIASTTCTMMYEIEDWQSGVLNQYTYYCQMYSEKLNHEITSISQGCWIYLENCETCYQILCLRCFPGYYADIIMGKCKSCPEDYKCYRCEQQSKIWKNGWKVQYRMMYALIKQESYYNDVFGNEDRDNLEIVCTWCDPGYQLYNGKCIVACALNCKTCIIVNEQEYCVECNSYEGKQLSLYQGQCIECPRYCSLCYPKTPQQLVNTNPYFSNMKLTTSTHSCLLLEDNLDKEEFIYNSNFKQFFKYNSIMSDPNQVILEFLLYCDLDQYDYDLSQSSDPKLFKSQNVKINEILSNNAQSSNFNRIENQYLYTYFGSQQIQQVEFRFSLLQDCRVGEKQYLFTTLTQNVYFLNQAIITLQGNQHNLLLEQNLEILGFDNIQFKNINIIILGIDTYINFQSLNNLDVILDSVMITCQIQSNFQLILTNIKSLSIQGLSMINANFDKIDSFFQIQYPKPKMDFNIYNLNIINSNFQSSNLLLFEQETGQISLKLENISISNSIFTNSAIFSSLHKIALTGSISDLTINQSQFIDSYPIFMTYFLKTLWIQNIQMLNSTLHNSTIFQITPELACWNIHIISSFIFNSSIFSQYINSDLPKNVNFNNLIFSNVFYDSQYSLLFISSSQQESQINIKNISILNLQSSENTVFTNNQVSPLFYLSANFITLQQITLTRLSEITEFQLSRATKITIQDVIIDNGNFFPSLITNKQCESNISQYQYLTVFYIEKSEKFLFQNVSIFNLILFNAPLIYIVSIDTQTARRQESILIDTLIVGDCILQKTQTANSISILQVSSEQQIQIQLLNSQFKNNFYHSLNIETESDSALILNFIIENGDVIITDCNFTQNYISQSQNSLMKIFARQISISRTSFHSNNVFTQALLKHINWGYSVKNLTLNQLSIYFTVFSQSGNGILQTNNLSILNTTIEKGIAAQAGCLSITLQNDGLLNIKDSFFSQISSSTRGGCFYIKDKSKSIKILIMNTLFNYIQSFQEGGSIYLQENSQNIILNFTNITIINSYSLVGAFINLRFSFYDSQILQMTDCKISQTLDGFVRFVDSFQNIDKLQKNQLEQGTTMIGIQQGQLIFKNIVAQLFVTGLLETTYSSRVSLTSVVVDHSFYGNKPAIMISCSQDIKCKVDINDLQFQGFSYYSDNFNYQTSTPIVEQIVLQSQCTSSIQLLSPIFQQKTINLSNFGNNNISSLIVISSIKASDQISVKKSQFLQNQCSGCQKGIMVLLFSEVISTSANYQIQNLNIMDNDCGISGCLSFFLGSTKERRLLTETQNQIMINQLLCYRNKAVNGACIYSEGVGLSISKSIINENQAAKLGGGLYYSGAVEDLILYENLITSNTAASGGALYIDQNSSPELNKTKNYMASQSNLIQSYPTTLTITLNNYKNIYFNYHTSQDIGFISDKENSKIQAIISLPSGQEISTYKYFNLTNQEYHPLNLTLRIVPLNNFKERQQNLTSSICKIQSGYEEQDKLILTNNQTSYSSKVFDNLTLDYNFDDLILYKNEVSGYIILFFECTSVKIPIYDQTFPYQIKNYINNYTLQLTIQLYACQLGEYENTTDQSCHLCDIEKKQYSVQEGAINCEYMNEDTTISITPAQLQLKTGYWRPFINNGIIERCKNRADNCEGGWKQGDETCASGQLGACCESCDYYNLRGQGHFSIKQLYTCQQCQDQQNQILYIIAVSLWYFLFNQNRMLISINLTTKGIENMISELQKNRVGRRQLVINSNKQTGPLMKMFTNYLQNIAIILNFNVDIPNVLKEYFVLFGNSQQLLLISTDCFLAQSLQENIIYLKILQCFINPLIYGLLYALLYMILIYFNQINFNKVVITTSMLYLFCYFQPQAMQLLISTLSYQTLSGIKWIQANLAYRFDSSQHQKWMPYLIIMTILLGIVVPAYLFLKLYFHKKRLYVNQLRKNWGYLFLEYQPNAYYWEFIRIFTRQFMILAITFYQDNIIMKCVLVFAIIFLYCHLNILIQPFKTSKLNQLDNRNSVISIFTVMCIFTLTETGTISNIILALIVFPNAHLFISFIRSLLSGYLQAYEQTLDKVKDTIRRKFPKLSRKYPILRDLLQNKEERRKVIRLRFKSIKKYLFQISSIMSNAEKITQLSTYRSGLISHRDATSPFLIPQIILSTNHDNQGDQKVAFLDRE